MKSSLIIPKVRFQDLKEGSPERKLMLAVIRHFVQSFVNDHPMTNLFLKGFPTESREEGVIDLLNHGLLRVCADDEGFGMMIFDPTINEYKRI